MHLAVTSKVLIQEIRETSFRNYDDVLHANMQTTSSSEACGWLKMLLKTGEKWEWISFSVHILKRKEKLSELAQYKHKNEAMASCFLSKEKILTLTYTVVTLSRTPVLVELFPPKAADGLICLCIQGNRGD